MGFRLSCRVVGAAAILGASISLSSPLALGFVDRAATRITCGTAFHADVDRATREDTLNRRLAVERGEPFQPSDYVSQCSALAHARRTIAASVAIAGLALVGASLYRGPRREIHTLPPGRHRLRSINKLPQPDSQPFAVSTIRTARRDQRTPFDAVFAANAVGARHSVK